MSTTETTAEAVDSATEGSFGVKPATDQVDLMQAVMSKFARPAPAQAAPDTQKPEAAPSEEAPAPAAEPTAEAAPEPSPDPVGEAAHDSEPAPAAEEEPPEETEPHTDSKGWPESAIKRTHKLTAQKKELEGKLAEQEARIQELEGKVAAPAEEPITAPVPEGLAALDSLQSVAEHRSKLESQIDFLDEHRHVGIIDPDGALDEYGEPKIKFSSEEVTAEWRAKKAALRDLPKIEQALRDRDTKYRPQLQERYDWWGDSKDARYQQVQATLRQFPELRRAPNHELLLANAAEMEHRWTEGTAKPKAPATSSSSAVRPPASPAKQESAPPPVPSTGNHAAPVHHRSAKPGMSNQDLEAARRGHRSGTVNLVRSLLSR